MSSEEGNKQSFHQFPLGLLVAGNGPEEKIDLMIAYATITAGLKVMERIGNKKAIKERVRHRSKQHPTFRSWNTLHCAWSLGWDAVSFSFNNPEHCASLYEKAARFISACKSPMVRVSSGLMLDMDKGNFDFRDFAVLIAVYAVIGDKQYAIVHRDRVRAGAVL
jgi:hypothetical protein